jgi:hypothetical protein
MGITLVLILKKLAAWEGIVWILVQDVDSFCERGDERSAFV